MITEEQFAFKFSKVFSIGLNCRLFEGRYLLIQPVESFIFWEIIEQ